MNFLKRLFQKKEEEIKFSELSTWLIVHTEFSLAEEILELKQTMVSLDTAIKDLERFNIAKEKIETKAMNRIAGNKEAYLTALKAFYKNTTPPEKLDAKSLEKWDTELEQTLNELNQRTIKNYHILKTIVGEELEALVKNLKAIEDIRKKIKRRREDAKLSSLEKVHQDLKDIEETLLLKKEAKQRQAKGRKDEAGLREEEAKLQKEIDELKTSQMFKEYTDLGTKLLEAKKEKETEKADLQSKFIPLERGLKKYAKEKGREKELEKLLKEKEETVLKEEKKLSEFLHDLEASQETKNEKDAKKTKIQSEELRKAIIKFREELPKKEREIKELEKQLLKNSYEEDIREHISKLNDVAKEITTIKEEENKREKRNIQEDIQEIEKELKKMGYNIKINDDTLA